MVPLFLHAIVRFLPLLKKQLTTPRAAITLR
jgi:hypothetical protein